MTSTRRLIGEDVMLGSDDALTIIGELNNAYNDGTQAKFTYGYKRLKQVGYDYCKGRTYYTVVADRFLGGKTTRKQRGTLDRCARDVVSSRYDSGGEFHARPTARSVGAAG